MKLLPLLLLSLFAAACESQPSRPVTEPAAPPSAATPSTPRPDTAAPPSSAASSTKLALTSNALQLVNTQTGSTKELPLGQPFELLVRTITSVLRQPPTSVGVNGECGARPLKMATWANGLTLAFQEKDREWQFVGWSLNPGRGTGQPLTSMAGVGLGSTRADVESAYVIKVLKSSLGQEFSTSSGLYGIFDGTGPQARVSALWSGTSCVFR